MKDALPNVSSPAEILAGLGDETLEKAFHEAIRAWVRREGAAGIEAHRSGLRAVARIAFDAFAEVVFEQVSAMEKRAVALYEKNATLERKLDWVMKYGRGGAIEASASMVSELAQSLTDTGVAYARLIAELGLGYGAHTKEEVIAHATRLRMRSVIARNVVICVRTMKRDGYALPDGMLGAVLDDLSAQWPEEDILGFRERAARSRT